MPTLSSMRRERNVRAALHAIARQRVALVLPNNIPVIECATPDDEWFDIAVRTCHLRGWVEVLHERVPHGRLAFDESGPALPVEMKPKTIYRLTEGGWMVINRSHGWLVATFLASALAVIASAWPLLAPLVR